MSNPDRFLELLAAAQAGDRAASESLLALAYGELRRLASRILSGELRNVSLQTTMMVNDAWMNLIGSGTKSVSFEDRRHFFGAAAQAMRRILVDYARSRKALRRGGGLRGLSLTEDPAETDDQETHVLDLHEALSAFEQICPDISRIVELRYFTGLSLEEVALASGRSLATTKRELSYARAWLHDWIQRREYDGPRR